MQRSHQGGTHAAVLFRLPARFRPGGLSFDGPPPFSDSGFGCRDSFRGAESAGRPTFVSYFRARVLAFRPGSHHAPATRQFPHHLNGRELRSSLKGQSMHVPLTPMYHSDTPH